MKNRILRVQELMRRELGQVLHRDFEFPGMLVTITDVELSQDLKNGMVYIGIVGKEIPEEEILRQLNQAHGMIQSHVARRVVLRQTPILEFRLDQSAERGIHLVNLMDELPEPLSEEEMPEVEMPKEKFKALGRDGKARRSSRS